MATSAARTVDEYLASLPPERRAVIGAVRDTVCRHLPDGYAEGMAYGMIYYHIPLSRYPATYNDNPLCYAGLAAQKNHYALYLMGAYSSDASRNLLHDVSAQDAGGERPRRMQALRVGRRDLVELTVSRRGVVAGGELPFARRADVRRRDASARDRRHRCGDAVARRTRAPAACGSEEDDKK